MKASSGGGGGEKSSQRPLYTCLTPELTVVSVLRVLYVRLATENSDISKISGVDVQRDLGLNKVFCVYTFYDVVMSFIRSKTSRFAVVRPTCQFLEKEEWNYILLSAKNDDYLILMLIHANSKRIACWEHPGAGDRHRLIVSCWKQMSTESLKAP